MEIMLFFPTDIYLAGWCRSGYEYYTLEKTWPRKPHSANMQRGYMHPNKLVIVGMWLYNVKICSLY